MSRALRRALDRLGIAAMLAHSPHPWRSRIAWTLLRWARQLDPRIYSLTVGGVDQPLPDNTDELIALSFQGLAQTLYRLGMEQQAVRETAAALDRARTEAAP